MLILVTGNVFKATSTRTAPPSVNTVLPFWWFLVISLSKIKSQVFSDVPISVKKRKYLYNVKKINK